MEPLGAILEPLGSILGPLGAILEPLGTILMPLGPSWRRGGGILEPLGTILMPLEVISEHLEVPEMVVAAREGTLYVNSHVKRTSSARQEVPAIVPDSALEGAEGHLGASWDHLGAS